MSESPTHPDAPRAETISPQARWKCACPSWTTARECFHLRYAPGDSEPYEECECACHEREDLNDLLLQRVAALLARHRDGERLDWLEHCNSQKRGEVPILPPSCGYSVRQYIDRQLADANTPCAAPPSPERASK